MPSFRELQEKDVERVALTFPFPTLLASLAKWLCYYKEQSKGVRKAFLIEENDRVVGYASLLYYSTSKAFYENKIPEIHDLWVEKPYRGKGLGSALITHLEEIAKEEGYKEIGIGFGLYKHYGAAQKLYFQLGYHPTGTGITYKGVEVEPFSSYPVDDDLLFWLKKKLS